MRIADGYGKLVPSSVDSAKGGTAAQRVKAGGEAATGAPAQSSDKVTVSAEAQRLAAQAAAGGSKVESLRASIADGSFKIDRQLVASRIVGGGEDE